MRGLSVRKVVVANKMKTKIKIKSAKTRTAAACGALAFIFKNDF
jgi:hypothetical protein